MNYICKRCFLKTVFLLLLSAFTLTVNCFCISRAESVAFLFAVMSICMLIELITSHLNEQTAVADGTTMSPFAFFDVLIALQGVFIFVIFICSPKPLRIVKRWWVATGSLDVAALTELEALKENSITILN